MKKLLAFTLAETLIVMGVIGIVSALTLPNLNSSTGDKEKVAKVKKIYQNLSDAYGRAEAIYGPLPDWFVNDNTQASQITRFGERLTEFTKNQKICGYVQTDGACWTPGPTKYINGSNWGSLGMGLGTFYKFILADGTPVAIIVPQSTSWSGNDGVVTVYFDIDGTTKGKNTLGKDVFGFSILAPNGHYEIYPGGERDIGNETNFKDKCWNADGCGCMAWVLQNDNMDYLKLDSQGKCPNGTILSWSNTSCK